MTDRALVILGSARKQGETTAFLHKVFASCDYKLIDLLDFQIAAFDYSQNYPVTDTFLKVVDQLLLHNVIVFATPVYWYAMSGLMKTFFDRFTDLVTTKKHLGRGLKGKSTLLIAVGADEELPYGFEAPFKLTSEYLDMIYQGCIYYSTKFPKNEDVLQEAIKSFEDKI